VVAALFGGSNFQVSGPTGAMTVVLIPIVASRGPEALPLVAIVAGLLLVVMAVAGIGRYVQSVTIGTGVLLVGVLVLLFGLKADISNKHRQLTQIVLYRLRKLEYRLFSSDDA
jgi:hypothetical protein